MIKAQLAINRYSPIDFFLHYFFYADHIGFINFHWLPVRLILRYFDCFKKFRIISLGLSYCMCFSLAELCLISTVESSYLFNLALRH